MSERKPDACDVVPEAESSGHTGVFHQVGMMIAALHASRVGKVLLLLSVGLVLVLIATAYGQIRLNSWNKPFFDALSRRDLRDFLVQLGVFFVIAGGLLTLNVLQRWLVETFRMRLREGLVLDLVGLWMQPRRAFWLAHSGSMGVNPDQRMHDDAHKLCDLSADLAVGLLQASILFVTFAGVLWVISNDFSIRIGGQDYAVPGFMVWAAILYAAIGSLMSYWVGRSLIGRNAVRYAREAELRFSLVHINEHLDGISLAAGENDERRRVEKHLDDVLAATKRLVTGYTRLTWVTAGFGWTTNVAPILVAAPLYLSGKISFGGLMMAAAAFTQAQSSLRWFVDNFGLIAEWRATLLRVICFRQALLAPEAQPEFESRIAYEDGEPGVMSIQALRVDGPAGANLLDDANLVVRAGERLLIQDMPGTSRTGLFRALAGLWPWGSGVIRRPPGESILYLPRGTPYLPRGSLREVLAYPAKIEDFADVRYAASLERLGLARLIPMLDLGRRWDRELSHDEQMSIAFSRILVHAPDWVVVEDALGTMDDEALERVVSVLTQELTHTSVIYVGRATPARERLFTRVAHLVKAVPESPTQGMGSAPSGGT